MVATEIKDGQFTMRTKKAHVKVSWQVTAVRYDAWANAHRIPTEEVKTPDEQGRYLHPELYGAPTEMNVWAVHGAANATAANASGQR